MIMATLPSLNEKELEALKSNITNEQLLYYKGWLYGPFGKRKTTTALRCSRKRAVLLHADRGWHVYRNHADLLDRVVPVQYEGLSQVKAMVKAVVNNIEPFNDVDLIVLDTVSQMQEEYVDFLLEHAKYSGNFREKAEPRSQSHRDAFKNEISGEMESQEITGQPDYHLARNKFRPVVRELTRAPIDVIYLAHEKEPSVLSKEIEVRPNVTDALYKLIGREATFLGFMNNSTKEGYYTTFKGTATLAVKSQIPSLTDKLIKSEELPKYLHEWKDSL